MDRVKQKKSELRELFSSLRKNIPAETKETLDRKLVNKILSLACFRYARTVLLFYPIGSEPDLLEVARVALAENKKVAFPRCNKEDRTMTFHYVSSLEELARGSYSIPEPTEDSEEYQNAPDALCIVPALSFDKKGFRLGYGGGYYDRFLKQFRGTSLGALYSELLQENLPCGYYDVPVNVLITEKGSIITYESSEKEKHRDTR